MPDNQNVIIPSGGTNDCFTEAADKGWIFQSDGSTWLYGGEEDSWHFNIDNWDLKACQLKFGLGRESFKALITPEYDLLSNVSFYNDNDRFIVVTQENDKPKAYPISLMIKHEVINETINGEPVMIAYCVLADLGAVYTRIYCDQVLTFALSGYTYHDDEVWGGLDAFVLWDRDTESLWWPLVDRAISGQMNGTQLQKYSGGWQDLHLNEIEEMYGTENVLVLQTGQTMDVPENWPIIHDIDCN